MQAKSNRAHYVVDTAIGTGGGWVETNRYVCVYHGRRVQPYGYRLRALEVSRDMSRPVEVACSDCATDERRCEHDAQCVKCPKKPRDVDSCGRDAGDELGGSW